MTQPARPRSSFRFTLLALLAAAALGCESAQRAPLPEGAPVVQRVQRAQDLASQANEAQNKGDLDEAIRLNREAIEAYPEFAAAWNNLGVLLMDTEQNLDAVAAFQRAGELAPTDPRPPFNIGLIWQRRGYQDEAAKAFEEAIARDQNYLPALVELVAWDVQRGRETEVTAQRIKQALLLAPDERTQKWLMRRRLLVDAKLRERERGEIPDDSSL